MSQQLATGRGLFKSPEPNMHDNPAWPPRPKELPTYIQCTNETRKVQQLISHNTRLELVYATTFLLLPEDNRRIQRVQFWSPSNIAATTVWPASQLPNTVSTNDRRRRRDRISTALTVLLLTSISSSSPTSISTTTDSQVFQSLWCIERQQGLLQRIKR